MCNRYATYGETNALHVALKSLELDWADETPYGQPTFIRIKTRRSFDKSVMNWPWSRPAGVFLKSKRRWSYHKHS